MYDRSRTMIRRGVEN